MIIPRAASIGKQIRYKDIFDVYRYGEVKELDYKYMTALIETTTAGRVWVHWGALEEMLPEHTDERLSLDESYQSSDPIMMHLTLAEVKALSRITYKEYINQNDEEAQKVATKIYRWLEERGEL